MWICQPLIDHSYYWYSTKFDHGIQSNTIRCVLGSSSSSSSSSFSSRLYHRSNLSFVCCSISSFLWPIRYCFHRSPHYHHHHWCCCCCCCSILLPPPTAASMIVVFVEYQVLSVIGNTHNLNVRPRRWLPIIMHPQCLIMVHCCPKKKKKKTDE